MHRPRGRGLPGVSPPGGRSTSTGAVAHEAKLGERSKPPSVRPGIWLSVRAARGAAGLPAARTCTGEGSPFHRSSAVCARFTVPLARFVDSNHDRSNRAPSAGYLPFLAVGFARIIGRAETCRFCSRADGLPSRACTRSPARRVGGLSSRALRDSESRATLSGVARLGESGNVAVALGISKSWPTLVLALRVLEGRANTGSRPSANDRGLRPRRRRHGRRGSRALSPGRK